MAHDESPLVAPVLAWFDVHERPLPWRRTSAWGVLVSEFMLQQTPVERVLPAWSAWLERWPTPIDLAASPMGDALRAWGRLGYPRRAQRLHQSATVIAEQHDGQVPSAYDALRALPGVGDYTASAVQAFAFGRRSLVLDTNVRRVVARAALGRAAAPNHITSAERALADAIWPTTDGPSARWSAAVMELGALVCTARTPACEACPVSDRCAWLAAGRPDSAVAVRKQPGFHGSDRQARGWILAALREAHGPVDAHVLAAACPDDGQRERAITGLAADGLLVHVPGNRFALPE